MKKVIGLVAVAALLFSADMNAQEKKVAKKAKAQTEKKADKKEKKSCEAKSCCYSKKAKATKED